MGINKNKSLLTKPAALRLNAENQLNAIKAGQHPKPGVIIKNQIHELEVHQIELEMQNEELKQGREELESSRDNYAMLYDFAPVGYFTFDAHGVIRDVNLAGAQMLEIERQLLKNNPFVNFIADAAGRDVFLSHLNLVLQRQVMLRCEIKLISNNGTVIYGQFQSIAVTLEHNTEYVLTSIINGTIRKQLEEKLQKSYNNLEINVLERTKELINANMQLSKEIEERKKAETLLRNSYGEIEQLKERLLEENIYLKEEVDRQYNFGEIVGQSNALCHVFAQVEQVAPMNATVLLLGETGTGKGVVARAIHSRSSRKGRPLIMVDCTTLPASLVESELFGRERGAFTGSDARQVGRFELADGGTIFLDEIGDMPLELQGKLLRIIQDGEFERLGSPRTLKVDVRIIAATNRDLSVEVKNGTFRKDLYYRLNIFPITLPPLRQRKEDIPLLVNHFVAKFNSKIGKKIETVSKDTLNALLEYHWPGNVRELESVIERAVIISQGASLQILDRFDSFRKTNDPAGEAATTLVEMERDHILQVLQKTGWRIEGKSGAAIILGLNASTLRARMRKYRIERM